jgi:hypothetical protein
MYTTHDSSKSSILDDETNLRAIMFADRTVLRARRIPEEGRENIRAARRRQAERNRISKSAVSPGASHGGTRL